MLCVPDSTTNIWIANQLYSQNGYSNSWIGYSDLPNQDRNYEWVSGCSSSYSNSKYGSDYYNNDCVYISAYNGAWYSSGDYNYYSIACSCQYPIVPTSLPTLSPTANPSITVPSLARPTISPNAGCQSGWIHYNNNCYNFNVGADLSWSGCKSQCDSLGASMLCIPDSTTNDWIAGQLYRWEYWGSWIGYSDLPYNDGNYEWVSGCSSLYSKSEYGSNDYTSDCVYMRFDGAWKSSIDSSYSDSSSFTCSCESLPIVSLSTRSGYNASAIIGIVIGCVVFIIILFLILMYFFRRRTIPVCTSIFKSPSSNYDISSSDHAYSDVAITCSSPDDNDDNDGVAIASSTVELQVVVTNVGHCANDEIDTKEVRNK
jgi:hypothetical protein